MQIGDSIEERAEMLEQTQWATELSWKEIHTLAKYLNVLRVKIGMPVFHEGATEAYMCIVVQGSVNVVKQNVKNEGKNLSVITKGKTFGEMALFDNEPRSATIVAADNTTLLVLTSESLGRLIGEVPGLAAKLLFKLGILLSQKLRMTSGKLIDYIE